MVSKRCLGGPWIGLSVKWQFFTHLQGIFSEFGCIWELKWCPSGAWGDPGFDCQESGSFSLIFKEYSMSLAVSGS